MSDLSDLYASPGHRILVSLFFFHFAFNVVVVEEKNLTENKRDSIAKSLSLPPNHSPDMTYRCCYVVVLRPR